MSDCRSRSSRALPPWPGPGPDAGLGMHSFQHLLQKPPSPVDGLVMHCLHFGLSFLSRSSAIAAVLTKTNFAENGSEERNFRA
jgi:hypothetical protein